MLDKGALPIFREVGYLAGEANALDALGRVFESQGEYKDARSKHLDALKIRQTINDRFGEATSYNNLGNIACTLKKHKDAINYYQQALNIFQDLGARPGEADACYGLGNTYFSLKKYQEAIEWYNKALQIRQELGDNLGEKETNKSLDDVDFVQYLTSYNTISGLLSLVILIVIVVVGVSSRDKAKQQPFTHKPQESSIEAKPKNEMPTPQKNPKEKKIIIPSGAQIICPPGSTKNNLMPVRESYSFSAKKVASIPCNSLGVKITGSSIKSKGEVWTIVQWKGIQGWIPYKFVKRYDKK